MSDTRILTHAYPDVNTLALADQAKDSEILTAAQFKDLYAYICNVGRFAGFSAVPWTVLALCDVIEEPVEEPEGLQIYFKDGWPVAVLEFDQGYRLAPGFPDNQTTGN